MTPRDTPVDLFRLLPAVYQTDDIAAGGALQAVLDLLSEQANRLKGDIGGLWDDFFVETAAEWVIPYLGDLVGNSPLHPVAGSTRADVAKTIYYRRRKGTLPMLEEVARDVTGWGARAVAFFDLLAWAQNVNHVRATHTPDPAAKSPAACDRVGTVNLRNRDAADRIGGAFEITAHTVDVRGPNATNGRYNVPNVGFFLYRLQSYPVLGDARPVTGKPNRFHVSPLGHDAPLFTRPLPERDATGLATELHVPAPIRPLAFCEDASAYRRVYKTEADANPPSGYVGRIKPAELAVATAQPAAFFVVAADWKSLALFTDGAKTFSARTVCPADLSTWADPPAGQVAVDVARGRIAFAPSEAQAGGLTVWACYGFSGDLGGGPYDRRRPPVALGQPPPTRPDFITTPQAFTATGGTFTTVSKGGSVNTAATTGAVNAVVEITDSRTYTESLTLTVSGRELVIQAANHQRPVLLGDVKLTGAGAARVRLDGLWIAGQVVVDGDLEFLELAHCTLVPGLRVNENGTPEQPGQPSLLVNGEAKRLSVSVERCVTGPLRLPSTLVGLTIRDSVIDSPNWQTVGAIPAIGGVSGAVGPPTVIERTTVFGAVSVKELTLASEVLFTAAVVAQRRQAGCVRFSHVPAGSLTPARYHCQPDLVIDGLTGAAEQEVERRRVAPRFTTTRYGQPGYAQLHRATADEVRTGAESGTEMGAFAHLQQPQREHNLLARLDEYLPAGLTPALTFVT